MSKCLWARYWTPSCSWGPCDELATCPGCTLPPPGDSWDWLQRQTLRPLEKGINRLQTMTHNKNKSIGNQRSHLFNYPTLPTMQPRHWKGSTWEVDGVSSTYSIMMRPLFFSRRVKTEWMAVCMAPSMDCFSSFLHVWNIQNSTNCPFKCPSSDTPSSSLGRACTPLCRGCVLAAVTEGLNLTCGPFIIFPVIFKLSIHDCKSCKYMMVNWTV